MAIDACSVEVFFSSTFDENIITNVAKRCSNAFIIIKFDKFQWMPKVTFNFKSYILGHTVHFSIQKHLSQSTVIVFNVTTLVLSSINGI